MRGLTRLIDGGLRKLDAERLIRASGYFDAEWYARKYAAAGGPERALAHFLDHGAAEGHDPGPQFNTQAYLAANPDVREAGCNALIHYLRHGRAEGRGHERPNLENGPEMVAGVDRVTEVFDPVFYAATNPDLPESSCGVDHFLASGWKSRRDPCAWFSVEAYLADHPDVAATGRNPFVHYLVWGCHEGRTIRPSARQTFERRPVAGPSRLAVLSMVRNEGDIIRAFAGHLLALFDDIVFVDHMSDDGTAEMLEALAAVNRRVRVLRLDEPGYIQSVAMTHMVRTDPVLREAGWVFVLDADEFLPFASRADFDAALTRYADCPVIGMRWMNLVPERYWSGEVSISPGDRFIAPPETSPFRKVAFQPDRVALRRSVIAQGNHALVETLNGLDVPAFDTDFPLLHLPVRSGEQLVLKLNQGVEAYRRLGKTRDAAQGTHWDQMMRAVSKGPLEPDLLNAVVVRYSEDKPDLCPITTDDLLAQGHEVACFDLAMSNPGLPKRDRPPLGEMLLRIRNAPVSDRPVADCPGTTRLETVGGVLRRPEIDPGVDYPSLPPADAAGQAKDISDILARMLPRAFEDLADLVPSAKDGHVPFLLALIGTARPRRVAEIGTLHGAGFLAMCQAIRQNALAAEAIAIGDWSAEGGLGAGHGGSFETLAFLAKKYSDFAAILRQDHKAAAERFADASLDLLLLDGFCEEEPLRRAVELWLPKLSPRGLLLMHDTNAHRAPFGVWRVWEDLADAYPALAFPHCEGFGLACIGPEAPPDIAHLCRLAAEDRHLRSFLFQHFENLGALSTELFSRRYDMARGDMKARAEGALAEELSWLRQEVESLRSENGQLRDLVQGGLAHAVAG